MRAVVGREEGSELLLAFYFWPIDTNLNQEVLQNNAQLPVAVATANAVPPAAAVGRALDRAVAMGRPFNAGQANVGWTVTDDRAEKVDWRVSAS